MSPGGNVAWGESLGQQPLPVFGQRQVSHHQFVLAG
jgi:hypothetical protein